MELVSATVVAVDSGCAAALDGGGISRVAYPKATVELLLVSWVTGGRFGCCERSSYALWFGMTVVIWISFGGFSFGQLADQN